MYLVTQTHALTTKCQDCSPAWVWIFWERNIQSTYNTPPISGATNKSMCLICAVLVKSAEYISFARMNAQDNNSMRSTWRHYVLLFVSYVLLFLKFTVSGQSKGSFGSQWGCESGVKLKKHTQLGRQLGNEYSLWGGISRANTHTRRDTPTRNKRASAPSCVLSAGARHVLCSSSDSFSSPSQHFILSLCSRRRWGVCYVKFPAIWRWSWRQLTCFLPYSLPLWLILIHTYTHLQNRGSLINLWHSMLWRKPQI